MIDFLVEGMILQNVAVRLRSASESLSGQMEQEFRQTDFVTGLHQTVQNTWELLNQLATVFENATENLAKASSFLDAQSQNLDNSRTKIGR